MICPNLSCDCGDNESCLFFFGFLGFLDRLLALHKGHIGAFRCICWWQDKHDFIGGGCCLNEGISIDGEASGWANCAWFAFCAGCGSLFWFNIRKSALNWKQKWKNSRGVKLRLRQTLKNIPSYSSIYIYIYIYMLFNLF